MSEQAPVIDPAQEQILNQEQLTEEQMAERMQLATALYNRFIPGEGQSDEPLEHPLVADDETAHRELLSQLQSVNGSVPQHLQIKRDWGKSQKEHLEAQKSHHSEVKSALEDRLKSHDELQRFKDANKEQERKTTAHNEKLAIRDSEAEGRNAAREAYISKMKTARGLKRTSKALEQEADAYVEETFGPSKHAKEGVADTKELKTEGPTASQQKNAETGEAWRNFHRGFAKKQPEGLLDDKDIPEFNPDSLKEQPAGRQESDFAGWEADTEELFADLPKKPGKELVLRKAAGKEVAVRDDQSDENPFETATRKFTEAARRDREQMSPRNRIRRLMGRANDMLRNAAAWGAVISQPAFDKLQGYFGDEEKGQTRRRAAIAGVVLGSLAAYGATRLGIDTGGGPNKVPGSGGVKDTIFSFTSPFGGAAKEHLAGQAAHVHNLGHHAVKAANEITLKPNVSGGDSIWREEYNQAHTLHPNWSEQQLREAANAHTRHVMDVYHLNEAEAEKLKAGATYKN